MKGNIKAVVFDIDNTLYDYDGTHIKGMEAVRAYCAETFGTEKDVFLECYERAMSLAQKRIGESTAATHNRMIRFQLMMEMLDQPLFPHVMNLYNSYWDTLMLHMKPNPGILELMRDLKKAGIKIGIGTDMTAHIQYRKLEKMGMAPYIDAMVTSEEAGVEKPHPHLFRLCVDKLGCEPQECVFIGDVIEKDVLGARNSGLHGVWYTKGKEVDKASLPFPAITSFREFSILDTILEPQVKKI